MSHTVDWDGMESLIISGSVHRVWKIIPIYVWWQMSLERQLQNRWLKSKSGAGKKKVKEQFSKEEPFFDTGDIYLLTL